MLNINLPGSGHTGPKNPAAMALLGIGSDFLPFPDPLRPYLPDTSPETVAAIRDANNYTTIRAAMNYIERVIKNHAPCNECFKKLPKRRTFKEIWESDTIWLNYMGDSSGMGETRGDFDIGITLTCLKKGKMQIVATIVHELAHIDGAPGREQQAFADGKPNLMAESTLKCCLLAQYFDPGAIGVIDDAVFGESRPGNAAV